MALPNDKKIGERSMACFRISCRAFAIVLAMAATTAASAQAWPSQKPIRMIVPLPAGTAVDTVGRLINNKLSVRLGQTIVVENRAGVSGMLAAEAVAKAAPDGYTLGMATSTTHVTAAIANAKLPYDPVKDFVPLAMVGCAVCAHGQSWAAGEECSGTVGLGQSQVENPELFFGRLCQCCPSGDRAHGFKSRCRVQSRTLSIDHASGHGSGRGPHRTHLRALGTNRQQICS